MSEDDEFEVRIFKVIDYSENIIHRWLSLPPEKVVFRPEQGEVAFEAVFEPKKPFKVKGELAVVRKTGGVWK